MFRNQLSAWFGTPTYGRNCKNSKNQNQKQKEHPHHSSKPNAALKNAAGSGLNTVPNTVVLQRERLVDGKFTVRLKKEKEEEEEEEKKEQADICFYL